MNEPWKHYPLKIRTKEEFAQYYYLEQEYRGKANPGEEKNLKGWIEVWEKVENPGNVISPNQSQKL